MTRYNCYCFECHKDFRSETDPAHCPYCNKQGKILGRKTMLLATNGEFTPHLN